MTHIIDYIMGLVEQNRFAEHMSISLDLYKSFCLQKHYDLVRHSGFNSLHYYTSSGKIEIVTDRRLTGLEVIFWNNPTEVDKYFHDKKFANKMDDI